MYFAYTKWIIFWIGFIVLFLGTIRLFKHILKTIILIKGLKINKLCITCAHILGASNSFFRRKPFLNVTKLKKGYLK